MARFMLSHVLARRHALLSIRPPTIEMQPHYYGCVGTGGWTGTGGTGNFGFPAGSAALMIAIALAIATSALACVVATPVVGSSVLIRFVNVTTETAPASALSVNSEEVCWMTVAS